MNGYLIVDPWKIEEREFSLKNIKSSESLFSIGNGTMGQRANFEEKFSGDSLSGMYIGGVFYPDKTRVGWWKNGYPESFAKVPNSAFWIGIDVTIDGEELDLAAVEVLSFNRSLDFREGVLHRRVKVRMSSGLEAEISSDRFVSLIRSEIGAIEYSVTPLNRDAEVKMCSYINGDIYNSDSNYNEKFWDTTSLSSCGITMKTRKSGYTVGWYQENCANFGELKCSPSGEHRAESRVCGVCKQGERATLNKYVGVCSSLNHDVEEIETAAINLAQCASKIGFAELQREQIEAWRKRMARADIVIEGDDAAQQGIRYSIFMLLQTYTGEDNRLNIGPKGFTGEKYGGGTYWDTEAYCIPFYMATMGEKVARNLLIYRYNQLDKAIENGEKLGFKDGAALYPMVTVNGEECHNEWEITFEEIHRNGAIAYAIYNYVRYTQNDEYMAKYGLEVLLSISRFWSQRVSFSSARNQYVILGVTGPNEYENNINNNWCTNYLARWCMQYTISVAEMVRERYPDDWVRVCKARNFDFDGESALWSEISDNIYLGEDKELGIFLQQDGYMDKEQLMAKDLDPNERPINQHWSWDRILRSCFIKQADVLQCIYYFRDHFSQEQIRRNFEFYEKRTVHESSLSTSTHTVLAAHLKEGDYAHKLFLVASRLDLDDRNKEVEQGLHVTSMAGSWLAVVEGFGGVSVSSDMLSVDPCLYGEWKKLKFTIEFRSRILTISISHDDIKIERISGDPLDIMVRGKKEKV